MDPSIDHRWRFLILEDNPDDVARITDALMEGGLEFAARVASTKEQLKEIVSGFTPDLVLSKYGIPHLEPLEALRIVRKIHSSIPFIVVSEPVGEDRATAIIRDGATDFILKSKLDKLADAVKVAIARFEDQLEREQDNALAYSRLRSMRSIPNRAKSESRIGEHARVLVLEDDKYDLRELERELSKSSVSFTILSVDNRKEYLRALMDFEPHIIISDFALPGFDGISALELRNELCGDVPFILTSGILSEEIAVESLKHGVTDYVQKGVPNKIFFAVGRALSEAGARQGRERAEGNLKRSELMFRQLAENIGAALWIASNDLSKLFYVNRAYERIWGQSADMLYRKPLAFLDPIHEDDRARLKAKLKQGHSPKIDEHVRILRPDGDVCWVWMRTFPISSTGHQINRVCGMAQDITEWKQTQLMAEELHREQEKIRRKDEERLRDQEATFHQVFDALNHGVFVHDLETLRVLEVNNYACNLFGYTREQIITGQVGLLSQGDDPYTQEKADEWLRKAADEGPQLFNWHSRDRHGGLFWVEVNLKRIEIAGKERLLALVRKTDETPAGHGVTVERTSTSSETAK